MKLTQKILGIIMIILMLVELFIFKNNELVITIIVGCFTTALIGETDDEINDDWLIWVINATIWIVILIIRING